MKKILLFFIVLAALSLLSPKRIFASTQSGDCQWEVRDSAGNLLKPPNGKLVKDLLLSTVNYKIFSLPNPNHKYNIEAECDGQPCAGPLYGYNYDRESDADGKIEGRSDFDFLMTAANIRINVRDPNSPVYPAPLCIYQIQPSDWINQPAPTPAAFADCELTITPATGIKNNTPLTVVGKVTNLKGLDGDKASIYIPDPFSENLEGIWSTISVDSVKTFYPTATGLNFQSDISYWPNGSHGVRASIYVIDGKNTAFAQCQTSFEVCNEGCNAQPTVAPTPIPSPRPTDPPFCTKCEERNTCSGICATCFLCQPTTVPTRPQPVPSLAPLCDQVANKNSPDQKIRDLWIACDKCLDQNHGIWTAIGCLPTDWGVILKDYVFVYGAGIAGGISFLYFLYGVFLILTSAGNAERIAEAREIIISALSGLLLIIFSVFLLRVVGVDILRIPGFT